MNSRKDILNTKLCMIDYFVDSGSILNTLITLITNYYMDKNEKPLTKKQRRELKRQEKLENKDKEKLKTIRTKIIVWVIVVLALGAGIYGLMKINNNGGSSTSQVATITEQDNTDGNPNADIVLIEYSDFQCPACKTYQTMVNDLMNEYQDKVYFAFRDFPLSSIHQNAQVAAQAAEASALQGKFWEMHDKLFDSQSDWSNESDPLVKFTSYAEELSLDIEKFKADYESDVVKDKISNNYSSGTSAKVNSTPSFFLNGEKINNPRTLEDFKKLIDENLGLDIQATDTNTTE